MNNLAKINVFLEPANQPEIHSGARLQVSAANNEFKKEFNRQIDSSSKKAEAIKKADTGAKPELKDNKAVNQPNQTTEENNSNLPNEEQPQVTTTSVEQAANSQEASSTNKIKQEDLVEIKELPLSDELRQFFADLTDEEAEELLAEISQWLSQLTPEELDDLLISLEANPETLFSLMPADLQNLVANLNQAHPEALTRVHQLVTDLVKSKADLNQLAGMQLKQVTNQQQASLSLMQQAKAEAEPAKDDTKPLANQTSLSLVSNKKEGADKELAVTKNKSKGKTPKTRVQELIANLNKANKARQQAASSDRNQATNPLNQGTSTSLTSKEGLNQLLQSASQGLSQNSNSASQLNAARSIPLMTQAANRANAQALANRLSIMQAQNMKVAEMRLDPPNLGKVKIQIRMTGEQASVNITAANPQARELLEQALPRLKEMLGEEGIDLADAQVFDDSAQDEKPHQQEELGQTKAGIFSSKFSDEQLEQLAANEEIHYLEPLSLIDYYA